MKNPGPTPAVSAAAGGPVPTGPSASRASATGHGPKAGQTEPTAHSVRIDADRIDADRIDADRIDADRIGGSERDAAHESSRTRIARVILEAGPQTAVALAARLSVTPAAIRRHLDTMLADGIVNAREQRVYGPRGRGRPAKVFALTDAGRSAFYQAYDDLAVSALRYIRETSGNQAVTEFARRLVGRLEDRYRSVAAARPEMAGTSALAEALTEDGYAASVEPARHGEQLCQHHCPVAHVAEQFPQLCEAETEVFSRLLGRHVQRLATIAHGDGVCTTHVPRADVGTSPPADMPEAKMRPGLEDNSRRNRTQPTTRAHRTGRTTS